MHARATLFAIATLAVAGCFPAFDFGAPSDAGETLDATLPGVDAGDATVDHTTPSEDAPSSPDSNAPYDATIGPLPATPHAVVSVPYGTETGTAQQQHLVFAANSGRFWFFYLDTAPDLVKTLWSTDLVTWTPGASLTLPMGHGGEGRNLAVAYRAFGSLDVVHVATSLHDDPKRVVWDTRATIAGASITFGTPVLVHDLDYIDNGVDAGYETEAGSQGGPSCDPDSTGVTLDADGRVYVATSWVSVPGCCSCDSNVAVSLTPDFGSSWDAGFVSPLTHFTVNGTTHSRQLVAFDAGELVAAWDNADTTPPTNVSWAGEVAGGWSDTYEDDPNFWVFPQDAEAPAAPAEEPDDWSICRIDDSRVYAVRRAHILEDGGIEGPSATFEHERFEGASWTVESTLAAEEGAAGSGVVLLTNGSSLLAATVAADGTTLRYATWNGSTWSAWAPLLPSGSPAIARGFLSGSGCGDPAHPILLWTEGSAAPYSVVAMPVGDLMP